ncbi:general odorant-binding protein 56a-like, partial [Copidosoma floridanum]|uniref:general odorant-binding protein 56a-like n=1 Tax=Copidosoma floridanum TaxID=29053 RepID=UPI000C6FC6E1
KLYFYVGYLQPTRILQDPHQPVDPNEERRRLYLEVIANCTKEVGITFEDYALSFINNDTKGIYEKVKCVNACMFKAHGIMRPNGTINAEKAVEHLLSSKLGVDVHVLHDIIIECSEGKGENDCDTAQKLMDCVIVR